MQANYARTRLRKLYQRLVYVVSLLFAWNHKGDTEKVFAPHQQRGANCGNGHLLHGSNQGMQNPCFALQVGIHENEMRGGEIKGADGDSIRRRWVPVEEANIFHLEE